MIATEAPPWNIPTQLPPDGVTPAAHLWFSGQVGPGSGTTSITYEFDLRGSRLAVRGEDGGLRPVQSSEAPSGSGSYLMAIRLQHEY